LGSVFSSGLAYPDIGENKKHIKYDKNRTNLIALK